jgi:cell division septal protein FtsQ
VDGNHLVSKEVILHKVPFGRGTSYFSVNTHEAEDAISSLAEIKSVELRRDFPNKVYITVHEKEIIGLIRTSFQLYPVFEDGVVQKKNYFNLETTNKPILEGELPDKTIQLAAHHLSQLSPQLVQEIERIKPVEDKLDQIEVITKRDHRVFVRVSELHEKLKVYPAFYKHPPGKLYLLESIWFKPEKSSSK